MKKLFAIGCASLLLPLLLFGVGAPVFVGTTSDYVTNSSGTISFVYSNRVRVIYSRGNSVEWRTNNVIGNSLWQINGQGDTNGSVLFDYSFGDLGMVWEHIFNTNQASLADSSGNFVFLATKNTGILKFSDWTVLGFKLTNGIGNLIESATRTGGALTNITLNAQGPAIVHVNGETNVNIVAVMNWAAGLQRPITLLITNRTATVRTLSFGATTNNWLGMGSVTGPISITNALWVAIENLGSSNNVYAAQYVANPSN